MRRVYGRHPVVALLETRPESVRRLYVADLRRAAELVDLARRKQVGVEQVSAEKLAQLADSTAHQGLVAEAKAYPYADFEDVLESPPALVLVLDSIQDPHNFGALVRSAESLGATGVIVAQDRAAALTGSVCKAAAGAVERIAIARVVNIARSLEQLKEAGVWVTGLAGEVEDKQGGLSIEQIDFTVPSALVVGAEGSGLRQLVRKRCDHLARIPMLGQTSSLNASVAGAIALYEAARQRRRGES